MSASRADQMNKLLKSLTQTTPNIEAAAVIDTDGLMMASALSQDTDEDSVAGMSAAMLGLSERIAKELKRGTFEIVSLRGANGYVIIVGAGSSAVLTVLADKNAKLGLVFLDAARAAAEVAKFLS